MVIFGMMMKCFYLPGIWRAKLVSARVISGNLIINNSIRSLILFFILFLSPFLSAQVDEGSINYKTYLEDAFITDITEEGNYIWVSTYGRGIFRYSRKDEKWENYSSKNKNLDNDIFHCIAVNKDYVWAGASEGLFIYDRKKDKWNKKKFSLGGEFGNWIRALCYDTREDILWIGRFRNLTRLNVSRQSYSDYDLTQRDDPKTNNFKSISLDGDSLIWFGTESGVHLYRKKKKISQNTWQFITNKRGFKGEGDAVSVSGFEFEGENVWFATDEFVTQDQPEFNIGGIYRFNRKLLWDRYHRGNGLPANGIYCIERTGNIIWAGLYSFNKKEKEEYGKGLVMIDRITGKVTSLDLNLLQTKSSTITRLFFDGSDLWIGTDKGLWKLKIANSLAAWSLKKPVIKGTTRK